MGLDSVELVMEYEDEFGIRIPDRDAEAMRTIGDVVGFIAVQMGVQNDEGQVADIRHRVYAIVSAQLGVDAATLSDSTDFVDDLSID